MKKKKRETNRKRKTIGRYMCDRIEQSVKQRMQNGIHVKSFHWALVSPGHKLLIKCLTMLIAMHCLNVC